MNKRAMGRGVVGLMVWAVVAMDLAEHNSSPTVDRALYLGTVAIAGLVLFDLLSRRQPPDMQDGPEANEE